MLIAEGFDWLRMGGAGLIAAGLAVALAPAPLVQRKVAEAVAANPKVNKDRVKFRLLLRYGWISVVGMAIALGGVAMRAR